MLAANYLPEDFNVTLIMKMYNNWVLPFAFHFSKSSKLLTDKQKGNPFFVFSFQVVWIHAAIADCQQWIYTGLVVHH